MACRNYSPIGRAENPDGHPVNMDDCFICGFGPKEHSIVSRVGDKTAVCHSCNDTARYSLAQEIREGLKARGLWAPENSSDLIVAIFQALDKEG